MNLNSNSWTNTWDANGGTETSEGYNFNDAKWNWLGGGHYNSDGWVNENSRIDYAADASNGNTNYTVNYADSNESSTDRIAYFTESHKGGRYDSNTGEVNWEFVGAWDYVPYDAAIAPGAFLGGYEVNGGEKVTYDKDWQVLSREVDASNFKDVVTTDADSNGTYDELDALPTLFADATKKSVKVWDQNYEAPAADSATYASYQKFLLENPQNGETQYFKANGQDYVPVGKVNNWSWFDSSTGDWGVGQNYDVYNSSNSDWPWEWAGGSNTHSNNGEINSWSQYTVQYAADASNGNASYTENYVDATNSSTARIAYYKEIGSNKQYDASGNLTWENSFEWDYAASDGTFLGGKETRMAVLLFMTKTGISCLVRKNLALTLVLLEILVQALHH